MGSILASTIISEAQADLLDTAGVRFTTARLLAFLNDGLRELVRSVPAANTLTETVTTVAGALQTLPADTLLLSRVTRAMGLDGSTPGATVTPVDAGLLALESPTWTAAALSASPRHYTYDPANPLRYYLYPPAVSGLRLEVTRAALPAAITTGQAIPVPDQYKMALHHYVLYRAYAMDAEHAANADLATAHFAAYRQSAGLSEGA